ncbi:MAG: APC family permease [Acidobacteriaceae bacterium]
MAEPSAPHLRRGFSLLSATALNISNVVGVGPFITIPLILASMQGPQAMLGWIAGALLATCDGMVWSELGAAWPGSGGSYRFLREAYGPDKWGRLMAFLFIWQFIFSGPLEIASGLIGFAQYFSFLAPGLTALDLKLIAAAAGIIAFALLYRSIKGISKLTVTLWIGAMTTLIAVPLAGIGHFSAKLAFSFPPHAFNFGTGFVLGLGSAMLIAIYDYMGYYDICYIGDEVRNPARTIPRSILLCILFTACAYFALEIVIIGVVPWRQAIDSKFIASEYMQMLHGHAAAVVITLLILWTAFASVFALLFGYSRIPYAAARDGYFFSAFAKLHPTKDFPHVSLSVLALMSIGAAFFSLDAVIAALITTRVLVQFLAQIMALPLLRKRLKNELPYRMPLYPLPAVIAFLGWCFVFGSSGWDYIRFGFLTLAAGVAAFLIHARVGHKWPFASPISAANP